MLQVEYTQLSYSLFIFPKQKNLEIMSICRSGSNLFLQLKFFYEIIPPLELVLKLAHLNWNLLLALVLLWFICPSVASCLLNSQHLIILKHGILRTVTVGGQHGKLESQVNHWDSSEQEPEKWIRHCRAQDGKWPVLPHSDVHHHLLHAVRLCFFRGRICQVTFQICCGWDISLIILFWHQKFFYASLFFFILTI